MSRTARQRLSHLLGGYRPSAFELIAGDDSSASHPGLRVHRWTVQRADGARVRAFLTGPPGSWSRQPVILYCHAHGNRYDIGAEEVLSGRPALGEPAYAYALAQAGIVTLCMDLPCFGSRSAETESAAAKRHLWHGRTLFGEMLNDLGGALDLLAAQPGLDQARIGAFGISMGATLAFWLAALDERVKCLAHLICFADLAELVRLNAHDLHGAYLTVPGLLPAFSTGAIAGLAAPRPQLACMGAADPLTPPSAIAIAVADARAAYADAGASAAFETLIDPATGHKETPAMRTAVLAFLARTL